MTDTAGSLKGKGFIISHLNVRSLLRHLDEALFYLGASDIMCYSETWLSTRVNDPLLTIDGYTYFRQDRNYGTQGGGLIIYTKESLAPYVTVMHDHAYTDKLGEELWVSIRQPGHKKTILGLIYRPPSGKTDHFITRLNNTMTKLSSDFNLLQTDVVVLGDFNVNYTLTQNPMRILLNTTMNDHGLRQIIKSSTRVTNRSSSLIDLIFTNIRPALINGAGVLNVAISDHMPVYVRKKAKRHKHPKTIITSRRYGSYSKELFGRFLFDNLRWKEFWNINQDPNRLWLVFSDILQHSIDALCPVRNIILRADQLPWIDKDLRKRIEVKDKQYSTA